MINEISKMNSSSTGGVCSSCLKEMPVVMTTSSLTNPLSKLCSNCMTEFVDQQHFTSTMNNKFPLLPSSQSFHQASTILPSHFSSLPSSSASSTSSSISSSNRRSSAFDPFTSGNSPQNLFLHPFTDFNHTLSPLTSNNFPNDFDPLRTTTTSTSNDFMRFFLNGNHPTSDRDSPASSIQSNDFSQSLFSRTHTNRLSTNDLPSSFCCFANNPPYTYCLDCETSLCEKCALTHPKIVSFKDHRQQLLSSPITNPRSVIGQPPPPPPSFASNNGQLICAMKNQIESIFSSSFFQHVYFPHLISHHRTIFPPYSTPSSLNYH